MRPCKNPPPATIENLLRALKPGRIYSPQAIALKFGISVDAARAMALGAVMLGEMTEEPARRGIRGGFWIPAEVPRSIAARRVGPLAGGGVLTGYEAQLWLLHDLAMASRGRLEIGHVAEQISSHTF
jgi:hypothetical protein